MLSVNHLQSPNSQLSPPQVTLSQEAKRRKKITEYNPTSSEGDFKVVIKKKRSEREFNDVINCN